MRTLIRCGTLMKLPVALSGLITEYSLPAAGASLPTWPRSDSPFERIHPHGGGLARRMCAVCASFKLAMTHTVGGTRPSAGRRP